MSEQPSIYGRMAAVLADVGAIEKTRKNQAQGFQFRGIDDAMNELHGTFAKHSLFLTHEVLEHAMTERETRNGGKSFHHIAKVRFTFWAPDGSNVQATGVGEAADTGDKGAGKAMAYALKVCLLQTFLIPTEEEKDPDYRVTEWAKPATQPPVAAPKPASKPVVAMAKKEAPKPAQEPVEPIPPGLLYDGVIPPEAEENYRKQLEAWNAHKAERYADDKESKLWLMREMAFYGISKTLANFEEIAGILHKLSLGKTREEAKTTIMQWCSSQGFKKG